MAEKLLEWIYQTADELQTRDFPNRIGDLRRLLVDFKRYRTVDKPPKFVERGNVEAHLFAIQTKLFSQQMPMYQPPDGLLISNINEAWQELEV